MKKATAVICALALLLFIPVHCSAGTVYYGDCSAPEIFSAEAAVSSEDVIYTVDFGAPGADAAENLRLEAYNAVKQNYTDSEIYMSPTFWILFPTKIFCEISVNSGDWYALSYAMYTADSFTFSLTGDILPSLSRCGFDMQKLSGGFNFSLRLITASLNYSGAYAGDIFVKSGYSASPEFTVAPFSRIDYSLPEKAVNNPLNTEYFLNGINSDFVLSKPQLDGYTFGGWYRADGTAVAVIASGTKYVTLTPKWIAKSYNINYVMTTELKFDFSKAKNPSNPVSFTFGEKTAIVGITSPVGGYSFDGWYSSPDFSGGRITEISADTAHDVTLYAKWLSDEDKAAEILQAKKDAADAFHWGDINLDGKITSSDARTTLRCAVKLDTLTTEQLRRIDFFSTGVILSANARIVLRIAVGLDDLYEVLDSYGLL